MGIISNCFHQTKSDWRKRISTIFLTIIAFLPSPVFGDTKLAGYDSATMDDRCFGNAYNITGQVWKAFRVQADASGTISYFKLYLTLSTDSTNDEGCWCIYADNSGSIGERRVWGCFSNYNWSALGVGPHTFAITNTPVSATIVSGAWYWIVFYSRDIDGSQYASSEVIPTERGNGECAQTGLVIVATDQNKWTSRSEPPPPSSYTYPLQSYHAWSVWAAENIPSNGAPSPPSNLRIIEGQR